jgi:hypothetical protein
MLGMSNFLRPVFTLLVLSATIAGSTKSIHNAGCGLLSQYFEKDVFYPGSTVYNYENNDFWSTTEILSPACIYRPTTGAAVGAAVEILQQSNTQFAVRSGGHMPVTVRWTNSFYRANHDFSVYNGKCLKC